MICDAQTLGVLRTCTIFSGIRFHDAAWNKIRGWRGDFLRHFYRPVEDGDLRLPRSAAPRFFLASVRLRLRKHALYLHARIHLRRGRPADARGWRTGPWLGLGSVNLAHFRKPHLSPDLRRLATRPLWKEVGERIENNTMPCQGLFSWRKDDGHLESPAAARYVFRNSISYNSERDAMGIGQPDSGGNADRPCPSQGRRSRPGARFYCGVLGFELTQRYGRAGGLHLGRRLSPPYRPQHLGEPGRLAAAAGHDGPLPHRHSLSDARRPRRCAAAADRGRDRRSTARPITASARRSICAIPTRTASSSTGTGRRADWPRNADGELTMFTSRLDLDGLLDADAKLPKPRSEDDR